MTEQLAARILEALDGLPVGKRGPKTSMLRTALSDRLDYEDCWEWPGRVGRNGYGIAVRPGSRVSGSTAHRVVWELVYGPVDAGMQVDHLCHDPQDCDKGTECPHRRCVNPTHLGVVTPRANTLRSNSLAAANARKTHCQRDHEFTPENTYIDPAGKRSCRTCFRAHWRRYYAERNAS